MVFTKEFWKERKEEMGKKISLGLTGRELSEEHKEKLRKIAVDQGRIPPNWRKGKTGLKNGMEGKHHTKESKIKISEAHTGEKHWNWQGGISTINHRLRTCAKYQIWRNLIFLRDNFTCQNKDCEFCKNKVGVNLHVHHIKRFSEYPELIFRVDNGITYCAKFHLKSKIHLRCKI